MRGLSAREIAEFVPCPLEQVRRLEELGIVAADDADGLFPSSEVHVVRLMAAFEDAGISIDTVARGVAAGELSFPLGLFLPEPLGDFRHLRVASPPSWAARPLCCDG